MLFCSTAYTTLFEWSRSIVSSVSYKTKQFANEVCFWTHIKRAKTNFFCCKVEVCCERAITFSIKVIWRVTYMLCNNTQGFHTVDPVPPQVCYYFVYKEQTTYITFICLSTRIAYELKIMPKVSDYTRTRIEVLDKQGLPPVAILRSLKNEGLSISLASIT